MANSSQALPESRNMRELMTVSRDKADVTPLRTTLDQLKAHADEMKTEEETVSQATVAAQGRFAAVSLDIQTQKSALTDAERITNRIASTTAE